MSVLGPFPKLNSYASGTVVIDPFSNNSYHSTTIDLVGVPIQLSNMPRPLVSNEQSNLLSYRGTNLPGGEEKQYRVHPLTQELVEIDPEQWWFWTPEWQAGEREADEDLREGRYEDFDDIDDFFNSM